MFGLFGRRAQPHSDNLDDEAAAAFVSQQAEIGMMYAKRLSDPRENHDVQRTYYENVRNEILELLGGIRDEYCHGSAVQSVIRMCLAADDQAVAMALLAGVRDDFLRKKILAGAPELANVAGRISTPGSIGRQPEVITSTRPDGTIDVRPGGQDYGFSIRPRGKRFALCDRDGVWFECDSVDECLRLLESLMNSAQHDHQAK